MRRSRRPKTEDPLFDLVKSLTGSEKRYLKLYSKRMRQEKTIYMELFDALEKMKQYDEDKLLFKLDWEVSKKMFADRKSYLFRFIMTCMRVHHAKSSPAHQLANLLKDIHFLAECGQNKLTFQRLKLAKKMAAQSGNHYYMTMLLDVQFRLITSHGFFREKLGNTAALQKEVRELQDTIAATL